jgi:hypothetical protein
VTAPIILPWPIQSGLEAATRRCLMPAIHRPSISRDPLARPRLCRPTRYRGESPTSALLPFGER